MKMCWQRVHTREGNMVGAPDEAAARPWFDQWVWNTEPFIKQVLWQRVLAGEKILSPTFPEDHPDAFRVWLER